MDALRVSGALVPGKDVEWLDGAAEDRDGKTRMALRAVELLADSRTLFIDGGTTRTSPSRKCSACRWPTCAYPWLDHTGAFREKRVEARNRNLSGRPGGATRHACTRTNIR